MTVVQPLALRAVKPIALYTLLKWQPITLYAVLFHAPLSTLTKVGCDVDVKSSHIYVCVCVCVCVCVRGCKVKPHLWMSHIHIYEWVRYLGGHTYQWVAYTYKWVVYTYMKKSRYFDVACMSSRITCTDESCTLVCVMCTYMSESCKWDAICRWGVYTYMNVSC